MNQSTNLHRQPAANQQTGEATNVVSAAAASKTGLAMRPLTFRETRLTRLQNRAIELQRSQETANSTYADAASHYDDKVAEFAKILNGFAADRDAAGVEVADIHDERKKVFDEIQAIDRKNEFDGGPQS